MVERNAKPVRLADGDELEAFVDRDLALVEFYTKGCTMCQAMEPVLGNVARAIDVPVGLINPGEDIELVDRFSIRSVPTLLLFRDGDVVGRAAEGFQGTDEVVAFVEEHASVTVDGA